MAITNELLDANTTLAALTDEQKTAIIQLSQNDENAVIGRRIGELHGQYDADILAVSGIAKNQGEKSYDYAKRVLTAYKEKAGSADTLSGEVASLKQQVEDYKKQIAEGKGDEAIKQQLKDAQKRLGDLQALYDADKAGWQDKYDKLNGEYRSSLIENEFAAALQGVKLKSIYPESVQKTLIDSAKRTVLAENKVDWIEENGQRKMVFRDANGEIRTNKANGLNPYTAAELLKEKLGEALDDGRKQTGAGTKGGNGNSVVLDFSGVKTQLQADEVIRQYLSKQGLVRGTQKYQEEFSKLRKEYGVQKLPIR